MDFSLDKIGRGAAIERFDLALQRVLTNIQDPNTEPKRKRSVILTLTIVPEDDRQVGKYYLDVQEKLAPLKTHPGRVFLGREKDGSGMATEINPVQSEIYDLIGGKV